MDKSRARPGYYSTDDAWDSFGGSGDEHWCRQQKVMVVNGAKENKETLITQQMLLRKITILLTITGTKSKDTKDSFFQRGCILLTVADKSRLRMEASSNIKKSTIETQLTFG